MLTTYHHSSPIRETTTVSSIELEGGLSDALGNMRAVELRAMEALRTKDAKMRDLLTQREIEVERLRSELNAINSESSNRAQEKESLINELSMTNRALFEAQERRHEYQRQVDGLTDDNARLTSDLATALSRLSSLEESQRTGVYELEKAAKERNEAIGRARAAEAKVQQLLQEKSDVERSLKDSMETSSKWKQHELEIADLERRLLMEKDEVQQKLDKALWKLQNADSSASSALALKESEITRLRTEFEQYKRDMQRDTDLISLYRESHEALTLRLQDIEQEDPSRYQTKSSSTTTTTTTILRQH